jgi:LPXTG-site transpeptidase (sortase) family protein
MNLTAVADDTADAPNTPAAADSVAAEQAAKKARLQRKARVRLLVARGAVVVAGLVGAGILFQGPVGQVWYESRQRNLATDLNAKRAGAAKGQALAILQIPKIGLDLVVVEGDGPAELRGGPGHRGGTPLPGDIGNSLIFAHRRGWGGPFAKLGQLKANDSLVMKKRTDPQPVQFRVVSVAGAGQGDVHALARSTDRRVTLVTAGSGRFSTDRVIVTAVAGDPGDLTAPVHGLHANARSGSKVFNATSVMLVFLALTVAGSVRLVGRRHQAATAAAIVAPLVLAALLALFLELDLAVLPPLH